MRSVHRALSSLSLLALLALAPAACGDRPGSGNGAPPCDTNADCASGTVCTAGACHPPGAVGLGGNCWANRDCQAGLFCSAAGVCGPAGTGGVGDPCGAGAECREDLYCDVFGLSGSCQVPGAGDVGDACGKTGDCIGGLVCGPDAACHHPTVAFPPFQGVDCLPDEQPLRVFFEVPRPGAAPADFFRLPFPSDVRVSESGALDLSDFPRPGPSLLGVDLVGLYADALEDDFRGFSSIGRVTFRFSDRIDFGTTQDPAQVHYIDVTPGAPEFGSSRSLVWSYTTARGLYRCQNSLVAGNSPGDPLLPGHTYAVYLTTSILGEDGTPLGQDDDFAAVLGASRPSGDDALARAWDVHAPFRSFLADAAIDPSTVAAAAVFTVQDQSRRLLDLAGATSAAAAPALTDLTLCDAGVTSPCEDADGRGACSAASPDFFEVHGRFSVPIFQEGAAPYELPADGGAIADPPALVRTEAVCFALTVPKATMPAGGWPVVVFGHGTGGSYSGVVASGVSRHLATAATPAAVFSFDGIAHGERKAGSARDTDSLVFNVINPIAARDNHLQGAVDVIQALRLPEVGSVALPGDAGTASFDPDHVYYFGHSQGANVGIPAIAVQDRAGAAIFSGAGSWLAEALMTKSSPVPAKAGLELLVGETLATSHPVMTLWQTWFDEVDTLSYAPLLIRRPPEGLASKHLFVSWGQGDTFSPESTMNATARAAGLPVAEPVVTDIMAGTVARPISENRPGGDGQPRTGALFQYAPDGYDGHFVATREAAAIADWVEFLRTAIADGAPSLSP